MTRLWLVTYDISDDSIRNTVHSILKDHGKRVQYSVFECFLTERQQIDLRGDLLEKIETGDSLRWYSLCSWCSDNVSFQGLGLLPDDEDFFLQ